MCEENGQEIFYITTMILINEVINVTSKSFDVESQKEQALEQLTPVLGYINLPLSWHIFSKNASEYNVANSHC